MENPSEALLDALIWMANAADEDCPVHNRTDDFNEALAHARELIGRSQHILFTNAHLQPKG